MTHSSLRVVDVSKAQRGYDTKWFSLSNEPEFQLETQFNMLQRLYERSNRLRAKLKRLSEIQDMKQVTFREI